MSDTVNLDALEALAKAATPGPWCGAGHPQREPPFYVVAGPHERPGLWPATTLVADLSTSIVDAKFIAAANPATVLALIERVRAAEALVEKAFDQGHVSGYSGEPYDEAWDTSDAKAALDELRGEPKSLRRKVIEDAREALDRRRD